MLMWRWPGKSVALTTVVSLAVIALTLMALALLRRRTRLRAPTGH